MGCAAVAPKNFVDESQKIGISRGLIKSGGAQCLLGGEQHSGQAVIFQGVNDGLAEEGNVFDLEQIDQPD